MRRHLVRPLVLALGAATMTAGLFTTTASGANSDGCEGGGYRLVNLATGAVVAAGPVVGTVPVVALGDRFGVRGLYSQFDVNASDFAVLDYAFTGAPNELDMTGGRFTPVWASKVPDHRGATLTGDVSVDIMGEDLVIKRVGSAVSMKIQAKDCAQGGVFQMEPERGDGQRTRIVHTLAQSADPALRPFFFDNTNFRQRIGQFLGSDCTSVSTGPPSRFCVRVSTRVNIANDFSPNFVARDSAQVADRVPEPACNTAAPTSPSVAHCGSVSIWDVASGGRMGFVTGEDAVEVANPPSDCVQNCQAQNQVRGRLVVLGFPHPVPAGSRLTSQSSTSPLPSSVQLAPSTPLLRAATSGSPGAPVTATVRWRLTTKAPATGAVRYQVRAILARGTGKRRTTSKELGSSARSHTMVLTRGTYRFRVRAINAAGSSAWSAPSTRVKAR